MNKQQAQVALVQSLTGDQMRVIKVMLSIFHQAWKVLHKTLTPRQRELLEIIAKDKELGELADNLEAIARRYDA